MPNPNKEKNDNRQLAVKNVDKIRQRSIDFEKLEKDLQEMPLADKTKFIENIKVFLDNV
jgi:hypothetical protein